VFTAEGAESTEFFKVKTPKLTDDIIVGVADGHKAHSKNKT
jgi:hypothetical protein